MYRVPDPNAPTRQIQYATARQKFDIPVKNKYNINMRYALKRHTQQILSFYVGKYTNMVWMQITNIFDQGYIF